MPQNSPHIITQLLIIIFDMEKIVLVGFLPDGNGQSCELHLFGCENSLVVNQADRGVGLCLHLHLFAQNELTAYTINDDGSEG